MEMEYDETKYGKLNIKASKAFLILFLVSSYCFPSAEYIM